MTHTNENYEIRRGNVYFVDLGKPDGTSKQAGIRPCVILSYRDRELGKPQTTEVLLTAACALLSFAINCRATSATILCLDRFSTLRSRRRCSNNRL